MLRKLGPIGNLLGMMPGARKNKELLSQVNDKDLDRAEAIVRSMTPEERRNPKIINGSRRARIANGSGVAVGEVSQLVTNFFEGQKQMKAMFSGGMPGMPRCPAWAPARRAAKSAAQEGQEEGRAAQRRPAARRRDRARRRRPGAGRRGRRPGGERPETLAARRPRRAARRPAGRLPRSLADGPAGLPPWAELPARQQGNVPAAFRGGNNKRKKK